MTLAKRLWNRLGTRLTVLFLLLSLVPLLGVGYLAYQNGRQTIERQQFNHLDTVNTLKADELNRWVQDNVERLGSLAQRPLVQGLAVTLANGAEHQLAARDLLANHLRPALADEGGYQELFLLRASDGLILTSTNEEERGKFRENETYFIEGRRRPTVQNVYYSLSRREPTMTIGVPVNNGRGNVVAVLAGHVNLEEMEVITDQTNELTETEDTYLVNSFNFFVTDPRFREAYALNEVTYTPGVEQCLQGESGQDFYTDYRGEPVLGAYHWLPEMDVCILTEIDRVEAFAPIDALRRSLLGIGSVVALSVVAVGLFFTRSLTRPLRQLTRGAKRIGQGDLEHRIDVASHDEIGQLADAFNEMTSNLRRSLGETAHGRRLLLALSDAAQAVQRARTPQEVYETVGEEVSRLGFNATVLLLSEDQERAHVAYLGYDSSLIRVGEKLAGVSAANYEFPLPSGGAYRRAIKEGEALFVEQTREFIAEALPAPAQRVAGRLATILGMDQSIVAPLTVDGETLGLLTVSGDDLAEADATAVKAFANQTAIALKNAQLYEEIRESEARFRTIFESAGAGIARLDLEGKIVESNTALQEMLGFSEGELRHRPFAEFSHPEDAAADRDLYQSLMVGERETYQVEKRYVHKEGQPVWVFLTLSLVRDGDGEPQFAIALVDDITERKKIEQEQLEQQAFLESIYSSVDLSIFVADVDEDGEFRYTGLNPAHERLTGLKLEEIRGKRPEDLAPYVPAEATVAIRDNYARCVEAGEPIEYEEMIPMGGRETWWLTRLSPIRNAEGRIYRIVGTSLSITERKRIEEELRMHQDHLEQLVEERTAKLQKSESRFRALFSAVPVPVVVTDAASGEILEANEHVAGTLGLDPEKIVGSDVRDLYENASERGPRVQKILEEGHVRGHELTIRRGDGKQASLLLSTSTIEYDGRQALLSSLIDLTERKEMEEALRHSEERFRALVHNASDIITILDAEGRVQYDSPSIERILGYRPDERLGEPVFQYVHSDDLLAIQEKFEQILAEPETTVTLDAEVRHRNGSWRTLEVTASNLLDDPAVQGIVVNSHDITERKRTQAQLERYTAELARSNEELQQFAYVASHDLQEPLRMVSSFLQLLQQRYEGKLDERADEYIHYAVDGATRMKRLINDLLQYSRVATRGKQPAPVSSQAIFDEVLADFQLSIRDSEATITHDSLPMISGDKTQVRQLMQNLIGNAIKFHGDSPPRIHVDAERENGMWRFAVRDEGIGIEPRHAERIFVIFQRLHGKKEYDGTGIGLAICKKIVERHGGTMWVESEPGAGSTFYFTLPATGEHENSNGNSNGNDDPKSNNGSEEL